MDGTTCPECGAPMALRTTPKFRYKNGKARKFWGCTRWPDCDGIHGAHPDGRPLGIPANKATKQKRIDAHAAFDGYCEAVGMTRKEGYTFLRVKLDMSKKECHIARFDAEQCDRVINVIEACRRTAQTTDEKELGYEY